MTFEQLGNKLESFSIEEPRASHLQDARSEIGLFVERTRYGTAVAGRVDLHTRTVKILAESRSKMKFLDEAYPECVIVSSGKNVLLVNAATGAQMDLPAPCSARRTSRGIVVWTPVADPKRAWLYDVTRWQGRAWWNANQDQPGN